MMLNFFKKQGSRDGRDEDTAYEEAVIVNMLFYQNDEAPKQKLQRVYDLEDALEPILLNIGDLDGHELSEEDATIYIYGKSADIIWERIEPTVREQDFKQIRVTLRYGSAEDADAKEQTTEVKSSK